MEQSAVLPPAAPAAQPRAGHRRPRGRARLRLYDDHVAELLDQAVYHVEHLRLGIPDAPAKAAVSSVSWTVAEDPDAVLAARPVKYPLPLDRLGRLCLY